MRRRQRQTSILADTELGEKHTKTEQKEHPQASQEQGGRGREVGAQGAPASRSKTLGGQPQRTTKYKHKTFGQRFFNALLKHGLLSHGRGQPDNYTEWGYHTSHRGIRKGQLPAGV